ncbi:hypothetical protein L596_027586 [Steinernema carpocapsae]|uniref:Uncharacterized protein n=1 Tax=Steinernema carpocapsae TaxID=34508 RepID=A0A4U5LVX1_STECR|nr:hypothetical protein L596_027586 [Steinernema carpocapsae]
MLSKVARDDRSKAAKTDKAMVKYLLEKDFEEERKEKLKDDMRSLNLSLRKLELTTTQGKKRRRKNVSWTNNPLYKSATTSRDEETDCESKNSEFCKSMDSGYKSDTASVKVDSADQPNHLMEVDEFHDAAEELIEVLRELHPTSTDETVAKNLKNCEVELTKFSLNN